MTADLRQQESAPVAKKLTRSQPVLTPATATPIPQKQTVMAQDDFQQDAEATSWTTTSDGKGRWEGDVSNGDFTIQHGIGWVAQSPNNKAVNGLYLTALLGPALQNSTVTADMALRNYRPDLLANDGVVLRYKRPSPATGNQSQYYKAYLDGAHLVILRKSAGVMTPLASVPFHAVAGLRYTLTFSANGNQLVTQVWQTTNGNTDSVSQNDGTSKKVTLSVQDSTLTNGQDGLRVLTQPDTLVQVYAVTVQQKNEP
jgi:hypothetical protein